jgi:hypothetical protein
MTEAFPDIFVFDGLSRFGPGITLGKTMTVVRTKRGDGHELTILNSAQLDDDGERALRSLGTVKHVVRLGSSHGLDDGWFIDKFSPTTWAPPRVSERKHGPAHKTFDESAPLPIDTRVVVLHGDTQSEAACVLPTTSGNVLVACDAFMAHADTRGMSFLGRVVAKRIGFFAHPVIIGPIWLKKMGAATLRNDFARLAALDFTHLIGGHGVPLKDRAHHEVNAAVARTLG